MITTNYDAIVIGAGILGLAHAYHLRRAGLRVAVFERNVKAQGASVRNFGMVWPIGQPAGQMREIALRSRHHWAEALTAAGIWFNPCGSIHLAYHDDELAVLQEFAHFAKDHGYVCELQTPSEVLARTPVKSEGLVGGLYSPTEVCVNPRQVIGELPRYLQEIGVDFYFGKAVTHAESGLVIVGRSQYRASNIYICSGDDFETLFPDRIQSFGMTRSKLQMLKARSRSGTTLGTHLCAGLTLGHYGNFRVCETLAPLLERFEREMPEYCEHGIHLLVSQHQDNSLTIGDSHHYGLDVHPFRDEWIDLLILAYLDTFLPVIDLEITERWYGVYAKHPTLPFVTDEPVPGVRLVTGVGGAGMTLSFGLAEHILQIDGVTA